MANKQSRFYATGKRKTSIAKVYLAPGKGKITVNGKDVSDYFPYATLVMDLRQPLELSGLANKYDVEADVKGGGFTGQTGAIRLGITKALLIAGADRIILKKAGLITRDSRKKERKKYGLKAARKAPQFSKR